MTPNQVDVAVWMLRVYSWNVYYAWDVVVVRVDTGTPV